MHAAAEGLLQVARLADGLSGRALRKLPFQAHAFYVQVREPSVLPKLTPLRLIPMTCIWM